MLLESKWTFTRPVKSREEALGALFGKWVSGGINNHFLSTCCWRTVAFLWFGGPEVWLFSQFWWREMQKKSDVRTYRGAKDAPPQQQRLPNQLTSCPSVAVALERSRSCKENLSAPQTGPTAEAFRDLRPPPEDTVLNGCYRVKVSVWEFCHLIGCSDKFCLDRSGALLKLKAKRIRCLTKRGI